MDEQQERYIMAGNEMLTTSGLVRKLQASIIENGGTVDKSDDSALTALAGFDAAANVTGTMTEEELSDFVEEFCELWSGSESA